MPAAVRPPGAGAFDLLRGLRWLSRVSYRAARKPLLRALRAIPVYRRVSGVPRNELAGAREAAAGGGRFVRVHPAERVPLLGRPNEPAPALFAGVREFTSPETFVAELPEARLYGKGVAVIARDGRVVAEATVHLKGLVEDHNVMGRFALPRAERLSGTTAVLSAPGGDTYFHWLFDLLPRIEILRRAGYGPGAIDRFAVNSTRHGFQRETLPLVGIDEERVLTTFPRKHFVCERMLLPSFPGVSDFMPRWACDFLVRSILAPALRARPAAEAAPERIYVSRQRGERRRIHNHAALEPVLERLGFVTIHLEDYTVAEQARIFNGARVIFGAHGSGFANVVFCRPGATLVELFDPDPARTSSAYWVLSHQAGVTYCALPARRAVESTAPFDLWVDVEEAERVLEEATSGG
jgi:capsular polysaccharide biosynthesis protein